MEKEITSRMNQIMELIIFTDCKTLREIADTMGISLRQVRYDISRINEILGTDQVIPVIETNNKGTIVINDEKRIRDLSKIQGKKFKCTKEQRVILLFNIIAFNIKSLNLNKLSKQLNVTRVTVKNDLNEIREILGQYHLNLIYVNRFYLVGDEEDIFEFRLEALKKIEYTLYKDKFEKIEYLLQEYIQETFSKVKLRNVMPIISVFTKKNNILIKDSEFYWLSSTVLLILWYISIGYEIPNKKHLNVDILDLDYEELFTGLEKFMSVKLRSSDKTKIKAIISTICNHDNIEVSNFNRHVIEYIYKLVIGLPKEYHEIFINDGTLLKGLYGHLERCYKKMEASLEFESIDDYQITLDPRLEESINKFCTKNKQFIDLSRKSDKELLKLHFANSLYQHQRKEKKRVLLVSGASKVAKTHLNMVLESLFEIEIVAVISKYDIPFYQEWENLDVVLFTESIPEYFNKNVKVAKINMILDNDDFLTLNKMNISPKEHSLDLHELYLKLDFLNEEDQLTVIKLINNYLQKQVVVTYNQLEHMINYEVRVINDIDFNHNYIQLNERAVVLFQRGNFNFIDIMIDRNVGSGVIKITANNPIALLYLLFKCYQQLDGQDIFSMSNDDLISLLQKP
ncbi:BglG family transcription antiterminator [Thomasclavelia sp.]